MRKLLIPDLFIFFGLGFITAAYLIDLRTQRYMQESVVVKGEVVDLKSNNRDLLSKAPKVIFTTKNGEDIVFYSNVYSRPPAYKIGEHVNIRYLPSNPKESSKIESFFSLRGVQFVFVCIGVVFIFLGIAIGFFMRD